MADLGRASVDLELDTTKFEAELKAALKELKDLTVRVHPALVRSKGRLQKELNDYNLKVKVTPTLVGTNARNKLQAELNALKPPLKVRVEGVLDKKATREGLQGTLSEIEGLGARVNAFESTDLTAREAASVRRLEALNQATLRTKQAHLRTAKLFYDVQQKIENSQAKQLRDAQALEAATARARSANLRASISELRLGEEIRRVQEARAAALRQQREHQFSLVQSSRELLLQATRLNQLRFDNINQALGRSIAGEALLTTLGNIFRSVLNLRRVALQAGLALATGFAAAAQATGAVISGISTIISGLGVLAGLGILTVGVKLILEDEEVRAAADQAAATFREVMTRAALPLKPILIDFFRDFETAFRKQQESLNKFFDKVSPAVKRLGEDFNKLLGSEKVGKLIERLGDSTAKFLDKIDLDAIFDGAVKISEAFAQAKKDIREAFGPGIFSGASVDGFIAGLQRLTRALVSAGDGVKAFKKAFGQFFDGVKLGLEDVLATIGEVGPELFGALGPLAKQMAIDLGQVVSSLIEFASVALPIATDELKEFSDTLSNDVDKALKILDEPFGKTLENAAELGTLLSPLIPIFARIAAALEPILGIITEVAKILAPIATSFFDQLASILETLKPLLETVEGAVRKIREFLEEHPAIQSWIGRILAIVFALIAALFLLRLAFRGILALGRGFRTLGNAIRHPIDTIKNLKDKRVQVDVDVDDDELDALKRKLDEIVKNKGLRVSLQIDDDVLDELEARLKKTHILKIRCEKEGDCDCEGDDDDDDDDDRRRRRRAPRRGSAPRNSKGNAPRTAPRVPPVPRQTIQSYNNLADSIRRTDAPINRLDGNVRSRLLPSLGRLAGKTGLGALVAFAGLTAFHQIGANFETIKTHLTGLPERVAAFREQLAQTEGIGAKVGLTFSFIASEIGSLVTELKNNALSALNSAFENLTGINVGNIIGGITEGFRTGDWSGAVSAIKSGLDGAISTLGGPALQLAKPILDGIATGLATGDWGAAGYAVYSGLQSQFPTITKIGTPLVAGVATAISTGDWSKAWEGLKNSFSVAANEIKGKIGDLTGPNVIKGKAVPVKGEGGAPATADSGAADQAEAILTRLRTARAAILTEVAAIRTAVAAAFTGLGASLTAVAAAIGTSLTAAFTGLGFRISGQLSAIFLGTMAQIGAAAATAMTVLQTNVQNGITLLVTGVTTGLQGLVFVFQNFFGTALPQAAQAGMASLTNVLVTGMGQAIQAAFGPLGAQMSALMQAAFAQAGAGASAGMAGITQVIAAGVQGIAFAFQQLQVVLPQIMQTAMQAAVVAAAQGGNALLQVVASIVSQLTSLAGQFYNAGVILGQNFANGLRSQADNVRAAGAELAGAAAGNFNASPAKWGPLAGRGDAFYRGQEFVNRLIRGLLNKAPELKEFAGKLASELDQFRNSDLGKRIERELLRLRSNVRIENDARRPGIGFGAGAGVSSGTITGSESNATGRILKSDTQASLSQGNRSMIQIRPGNISVTLAGIQDPREFLNSLSRELVTHCTAR